MNSLKFILFSIPLLIIGCSGINTITGKDDLSYSNVGDLFLNDQVKVVSLKIVDKQGIKTWNINLQNLMWFDLNLEIKMDFYDQDGIKIDNPWGWQPFMIEKSQTEWIKFIAPNSHAKDFKLYIKKAG